MSDFANGDVVYFVLGSPPMRVREIGKYEREGESSVEWFARDGQYQRAWLETDTLVKESPAVKQLRERGCVDMNSPEVMAAQ